MKIKRIKFYDDEVLGNLELDFCDENGNPVDTVLIAGENGTGKSTILKRIHEGLTYSENQNFEINFLLNSGIEKTLKYKYGLIEEYIGHSYDAFGPYIVEDDKLYSSIEDVNNHYYEKIRVILSGHETLKDNSYIENIKYSDVDEEIDSIKSEDFFENEIKQFLVDIQAMDDTDIANKVKSRIGEIITEELFTGRITRFEKAFSYMFDNLVYKGINKENREISVLFEKDKQIINLDNLSSGEKQIIYRGTFLLKNKNSLEGAIVLIDEPEISMHPNWQMKIMDYYKNIFTNSDGVQTSQIFAVTHSPFIIHDENRKNDKVIVLKRDENGKIYEVKDPKFPTIGSPAIIKSAFNIPWINKEKNYLYLEGQTDKQYFLKAKEVFDLELDFEIEDIGYIENNQSRENGEGQLYKTFKERSKIKNDNKIVVLFDSDVIKNGNTSIKNNVIKFRMKKFKNDLFNKGIENLLSIDKEIEKELEKNKDKYFNYEEKKIEGQKKTEKIPKGINKQTFCDYILNLDNSKLEKILENVKEEIKTIQEIIKNNLQSEEEVKNITGER
ncbi:AAA family ATPase [Miniphocaeibacter massiliensis]|uniref:AAA family ATPase n=1 Tax=Miniphocaeibacter massiliensis TaxID=2041841 RepID=UPI000C1BE494|nr:AAA family ATPase [Miniphocaeibacter massiliensis]